MANQTLSIPASANFGKVDPRLADIVQTAAASFPYRVAVTPSGGFNNRDSTPNHPAGRAVDVQIYAANGKGLGNRNEAASFRIYEQWAQAARAVQQEKYPELANKLAWGGYFRQGVKFDQMHLDIGGTRGKYGSWETGLNDLGKKALPGAVSVGMDGTAPKPAKMSTAEYRQALAALGYTGASAVKQFQRDAGLKTDGIVGKDTTRALRSAIDQGTTFANGQGTPAPGMAIPRERPQSAPTVSASDKARAYGEQQPMAAPVMPVQRADLAPPAQNYDPLSSMQAPRYAPTQAAAPGAPAYDPLSSVSPPRASVAPLAAPQIATGSSPGIGSDPDRNFTSPYDPQFGPSLNASILATRVNQDYRDLRNGYPATNGTGARLPQAQGAEVMGGNSAFGAGYFDGYAPPPNFSSRISSYDPLSSIQSVPPQTPAAPISPASFDDRWNAVMDLPSRPATPDALPYSSGSQATSSWDSPYSGPDVGYQDAPVYPSPSSATGTTRVPASQPRATNPTAPVLTYEQPRVAQTSKVPTSPVSASVNGTPTANPPAYDPLSSVQAPTAAPQAAYDPLSSVQAPLPAPEAATVGPAPLGDLTPLQPAKPRSVSPTPKKADQKQQEADPWAATPRLFRPAFGLGVAGSMVGGLTLGPLGALLGRVAGNQIGKHLAPTQLPTPTNYIGSGLGAIEAIRSGQAPAGSFAVARNNANGYVTRWSNVGPQNSPVQTTYTPSGNSYSTYSIGPSLSPMQVTVFHGPDQQSTNGGGSGNMVGNSGTPGTGGLY